ncbi:MAG: tetratricopeptide repeat protein [Pseudomonadota bacterium]
MMTLKSVSKLRNTQLINRAVRLALLGSTLSLAACGGGSFSSTYSGPSASITSEAELMPERNLRAALREWERRYQRNPRNKTAAMNFAATLRAAGRYEQAVAILRRTVLENERDRDVLAAYAKALTSAGRFSEALQVISRAHTEADPDWRLHSAQGTILDQLGRHGDARIEYGKALQIVPDEPTVLSNLGMSYLLEGNLPEAERTLRQAVQSGRNTDRRVRANLALVVGLQGRFDEAMQLARQDLPPEQAEANIGYLREMLSEPDRWGQIAQSE